MNSLIQHRTGRLAGALFAVTLVAAACSTQDPEPNHLEALQLSSSGAQLAKGTTARLTVAGIYHDHTTADLTATATWASADAAVAAVTAPGEIRGSGVGSTVIRATWSGLSAEAPVVVTAARIVSLQVTPPVASVAKGLSVKLTATGTFTDSTTQDVSAQASWSSSAAQIVRVEGGVAAAQGVGTALVTAKVEEVASAAALEVTPAKVASITISPASPVLPVGTSVQLVARGHLTDETNPILGDVTWTSGDTAFVTVTGAGLLEAKKVGVTTVSAELPIGSCTPDFGCKTTMNVTVTAERVVSISVEPANLVIPAGLTRQYRAMATLTNGDPLDVTAAVEWSSTDPLVASVSVLAPKGLVTTLKPGAVTLAAKMRGWVNGAEADVVGTTSLTVSDAVLLKIEVEASAASCREPCGTLALGLSRQFVAWGTYSGSTVRQKITDQVTWSSSNPGHAVVSNAEGSRGLVTSVGLGPATITATCPRTLVSGATALTVSDKLLVSVRIDPTSATVPRGDTMDFKAIGRFTDNSEENISGREEVGWEEDHGVVLSDCSSLTAADDGCVVTADTKDAELGVATITVTTAAECPFCQVTGLRATASLEITPAILRQIELTEQTTELTSEDDKPDPWNIPARLHHQLIAEGVYSDGSRLEITDSVAWNSSDLSVATIGNGGEEEHGLVQGWSPGVTTITASKGGVTSEPQDLTVNSMLLRAVVIESMDRTLVVEDEPAPAHANYQQPEGVPARYQAIGAYSDGPLPVFLAKTSALTVRRFNITAMATWESHPFVEATAPVATTALHVPEELVEPVHEDVTALGLGHATLSAEDPHTGIAGSVLFEAIDAIAVALIVEPATATVPAGLTQAFTAKVLFSNATDYVPMTADCEWSVSSGAAEKVAAGLIKGITAGATVTVTASFGGVSGTALLTISAAELLSIAIVPADATIPLGTSVKLVAYGYFSDHPEDAKALGREVVWDSDDHATVIVSNACGSRGLAISLLEGTVTITALLKDPYDGDLVSGTTTLTVGPPAILALEVAPVCETILVGDTLQYSATAWYTDGGSGVVTDAVAWSVAPPEPEAPAVASIDASGLATGLAAGSTEVTATAPSGATGSTTLTVECRCDCSGCEGCTSCQ